jgi:hypothetical protein
LQNPACSPQSAQLAAVWPPHDTSPFVGANVITGLGAGVGMVAGAKVRLDNGAGAGGKTGAGGLTPAPGAGTGTGNGTPSTVSILQKNHAEPKNPPC